MAPLWDHPRGRREGEKRRDNLLFPSLLFCRVGNEGLPRTEKFKDTSRANQKHSSSSPLLLLRQQQRRSCRKGIFFSAVQFFVALLLSTTHPLLRWRRATKCSFFPFSLRCKIEASSFYELHFFGTRKKRGEGRGKKPGAKYPQNRSSRISFIPLPSPPFFFLKALFLHAVGTVLLGTLKGVGGLLWAY